MTSCQPPCEYNEYRIASEPPKQFADGDFGNETVFGLEAISENTEFQEEVLLYPSSQSEKVIQSNTEFTPACLPEWDL